MGKLVWTFAAAAALAACEAAPTPSLPQPAEPPTYQWRVESDRLGELLVSAWRDGEWFRVTVRGTWPAESLPATSVRVYRVFAERSDDGAWRTVSIINLETIGGHWRRNETFELETRYWAQTLEHPEEGGFPHLCMGPRAWCHPVNLLTTDDPAAPWSYPRIDRPGAPPPPPGNRVAQHEGQDGAA